MGRSLLRKALLIVGCAILAFLVFKNFGAKDKGALRPMQAAPVRIAQVLVQDVPHFLNGLGTVLPSSDVLVKSRVSGQLVRLHFHEGQHVKAGALLAEIDPRPFAAALAEAKGKLSADQAQLFNARRDLRRYASLVKGDFVERQKYDAQLALVKQYEGAVAADEAACENARLQLEYSRITAPASGLTGLRKVDAGNQIQANDSEGLVRITEITPCEVLFTLPETTIPLVTNSLKHKKGAPLLVQAWDREQKKLLAKGTFLSLDNEIDANTGTVRLKARFANTERELYAQQFVNARLCVEIIEKAITIPSSAVQLGAQGSFVYVLKNMDGPKEAKGAEKEGAKSALEVELLRAAPKIGTIERRVVKLGLETARLCVIYEGLKPGEWVVVDGLDRLREGSKAKVAGHISTPLAEKL